MEDINNMYNNILYNKYCNCKYFSLSYDATQKYCKDYIVLMVKFINSDWYCCLNKMNLLKFNNRSFDTIICETINNILQYLKLNFDKYIGSTT